MTIKPTLEEGASFRSHGKISLGGLEFDVARARIDACLDLRSVDERTNVADWDAGGPGSGIRWTIEVASRVYESEYEGEPYEVTPHFIDQDLPARLGNWEELAGREFAYDHATADPLASGSPTLHLGQGDILPTSLLTIGARTEQRFAFTWTGTCYAPLEDDFVGPRPFAMRGEVEFGGLLVMLHDEGGDARARAEELVAPHFRMDNLEFVAVRPFYRPEQLEPGLVNRIDVSFRPRAD